MAFQGGPLSVLGITPAFRTQLATATAASAASMGVRQVWQGAGQSFLSSAGQALAGNVAGSAVNIALNSALGTQVAGPGGLNLTSGANVLASTITPFVTSAVSAGINQNIQQALQSAGPFGSVLSQIGTGLVSQAFGSITGQIAGGATFGQNYKMFPGGGGEDPSNYGGRAYTLSDIVFSLQPANQGPQQFGLSQAFDTPFTATKISFTQAANLPITAGSPTANALKQASMGFGDVKNLSYDPAKISTARYFYPANWIAPNLNLGR